MLLARLATLLLLALLQQFADAVLCLTCVEANGNCLQLQDCGNNYCIYEKIETNAISVVRRSCQPSPRYSFDDGRVQDIVNECVVRRTAAHAYEVKVCNDADYCNRQCAGVLPLPTRRCHDCVSTNGEDCYGSTCTGTYCTYERVISGRSLSIRKSCSNEAVLRLADGTILSHVNSCETKSTTQGVSIFAKICNDIDNCNDYCSNPSPLGRTLTCESCAAENAVDCDAGSSCTGQFCVYERIHTSDGSLRVQRSCSNSAAWQLPDGSFTKVVNQCEARSSNGHSFFVEVCNTGDRCASDCVRAPSELTTTRRSLDAQVTCFDCSAHAADCYSGSCRGNFCYYYLVYDRATGATRAQRGCSPSRELDLDDAPIDAYGSCKQISQTSKIVLANTCDSMSHCDSGCSQLAATLTREILCTNCASAGTTCQGTTCTGKYCYYYREFDSLKGNFVYRGCSNTPEKVLPSGRQSHGYNQCDYDTESPAVFVYHSCNRSNFCDTMCADVPLPLLTTTTTPWRKAAPNHTNFGVFASLLCVLFLR